MCRCLKIAIVHDVAEGVQDEHLHAAHDAMQLLHAYDMRPKGQLAYRSNGGLCGMDVAIVGDITPADGVSDEDKHQLEAAAMARIRDMLGSNTAAGQHTCPASARGSKRSVRDISYGIINSAGASSCR